VVLVEETLIKAVDYTRTTPLNEGVVVVNSKREAAYLARFLPTSARSSAWSWSTPSATTPALAYKNLTGLGYDRLSTEGRPSSQPSEVASQLPPGAVARATGCVSLESLEAVVADPAGARRGYEECQILEADQLAEAAHAVTTS